ncbi:MAG TPA: Ldh family oxidoreductase [Dongiaceae bacterium]|nr:Ldh family oxidoreductase [Dongiaceae bacterium]
MTPRYDYAALLEFSTALGCKAGLSRDRARTQAEVLLEADLLGHTTHGLNLLPNYLKDLESGATKAAGDPTVVSDRGSALVWDGNNLPGTWLVSEALGEARRRMREHAAVTVVIRRSGHIGALISYLRQATDDGRIITLMTTNPLMRTVVPAGGVEPVLAPNPIAFGCPTDGDPILIDISTSAVANGWVRRWAAENRKLPEKWLQDSQGNLTDDPKALFGPPAGSLLPLGGIELGHKGFALGLIVEILTGSLTGVGRTGAAAEAGNLVYLQLMDPEAFSGLGTFTRDTGLLATACRDSKPRSEAPVRMPGDRALAHRRAQLAAGVELHPSILPALQPWTAKLGVQPPRPLA